MGVLHTLQRVGKDLQVHTLRACNGDVQVMVMVVAMAEAERWRGRRVVGQTG